ncbi:hypothetical protein [Flavobacterium sp. XS2P39]|uniref:hypothetical protein n=1 Tax=Flavobacterium sp. XS2P39 TaxID=3401725 RepID=UPI003AAFAB34
MIFNTNFKKITLVKNGLILDYKSKPKKEILFSELDEIYITVKKIKTIYELSIILLSMGIAAFSYFYLQTDIILLIAFLIVIAIVLKMNDFKSYGLKIRLKNGDTFEKQVPAKSKHETIDLVNDVRKGLYNYKIKNSNEVLLEFSL